MARSSPARASVERGQRDLPGAGQRSPGRLSGAADVDELEGGFEPPQLGELFDRQARAGLNQLGSGGEHLAEIVELADDPVVTDAAQPHLGFEGHGGIADEHDVALGRQHVARPFGEAALETDVDRTPQVAGGEVGGFAGVEQHRPPVAVRDHRVDVEQRGRLLVEQRVELAVAPGVELEVAGAHGLALGHGGDELVLGHGLEGVVG